jgi:hypothetical protein
MSDEDLRHIAIAIGGLTEQIAADRDALGGSRGDRRHRDRLDRYLAALHGVAEHIAGRRLDVVDDEDTEDVPAAVRALAHRLSVIHRPGWPPTHPYPGNNSERAGRGDPGHCWICAVVGHAVAHPERGCADVQCYSEHTVNHDPLPWLIDMRPRMPLLPVVFPGYPAGIPGLIEPGPADAGRRR